MLFHEIYGAYYETVADILALAQEGELTRERLNALVREKAFEDSWQTIPSRLKEERWPLLMPDLHTPLEKTPTMPLTLLERRWLKALLLDPRIALFQPDLTGLEDVEPLYRPEDLSYPDRSLDGDPYNVPEYQANFRTILKALRNRQWLQVVYHSAEGDRISRRCLPQHLEYSPKDDKFRLIAINGKRSITINLARVQSCVPKPPPPSALPQGTARIPKQKTRTLTFLIRDQRQALERILLHFSHLEKETTQIEEDLYRCTLTYDAKDHSEMRIRVLSFGPMLQVVDPPEFVQELRERLARQRELLSP